MKKYIIVLSSGIALEAKIEPRFKEKGISTKYDKKIDAMIYTAKWGQGSPFDNPLRISIYEFGDKAGKYANTSWLQVTIERSGNAYVGMEYVNFYYSGRIQPDRVILSDISSVQGTLNQNLRAKTFNDFWSVQVRGDLAKEWANRMIRLAQEPTQGQIRSFIDIQGSGAFSDSYFFTEKDKEGLRKLGEAWLKYFAE